jgi:hypothetical protein
VLRELLKTVLCPKNMKIHIICAQKPNTEMAENLPCNAALMVGVVCTSNLQTDISQTPNIQTFYSKTVKTVYEAHDILHVHMHCAVFYLAEN